MSQTNQPPLEDPMTEHAHLELIGLAIGHLDEVTNPLRRADLLDAAAEMLEAAKCPQRASQARTVAAHLRVAEDTQQSFARLF